MTVCMWLLAREIPGEINPWNEQEVFLSNIFIIIISIIVIVSVVVMIIIIINREVSKPYDYGYDYV